MTAAWAFELLPLLLLTSPTDAALVAVCDAVEREADSVCEILEGLRETDGVCEAPVDVGELLGVGDTLMTVGGTVSAKPPDDPGTAE